MSNLTTVEIVGRNRIVCHTTFKSRAEARRFCKEKNERIQLLRKAGYEGYEYASARILD